MMGGCGHFDWGQNEGFSRRRLHGDQRALRNQHQTRSLRAAHFADYTGCGREKRACNRRSHPPQKTRTKQTLKTPKNFPLPSCEVQRIFTWLNRRFVWLAAVAFRRQPLLFKFLRWMLMNMRMLPTTAATAPTMMKSVRGTAPMLVFGSWGSAL